MSDPDLTRGDASDPTAALSTRGPSTDPAGSLDSLQTQPPSSYPETRDEPESLEGSIPTRIPVDSDPSTEPNPPALDRNAPPHEFPGYTLLETLGEGGMGIVYKARQEGLNRLVALKVILGGRRAGPKDLIRFLAEAEAVAAVRHPHVVQVFEYGEADGRPFLAMEYLPGGSLADRIKPRQRLEPHAAASLVAKLALAVQAAHDQGIVSRTLRAGLRNGPVGEKPCFNRPSGREYRKSGSTARIAFDRGNRPLLRERIPSMIGSPDIHPRPARAGASIPARSELRDEPIPGAGTDPFAARIEPTRGDGSNPLAGRIEPIVWPIEATRVAEGTHFSCRSKPHRVRKEATPACREEGLVGREGIGSGLVSRDLVGSCVMGHVRVSGRSAG